MNGYPRFLATCLRTSFLESASMGLRSLRSMAFTCMVTMGSM